MRIRALLILSCIVLAACNGPALPTSTQNKKKEAHTPVARNRDVVCVAAIQCYSRMGEIEYNRKLLTGLIKKAAKGGAKIVVVPECAVTGYMDPANDITWTSNSAAGRGEIAIAESAEPVPGPSTGHFSALVRELDIYLALSLAEKAEGCFYNSQVLLDPNGKMIAHHRKRNLWPPGDASWVTRGERPLQVVETPYGKLGLMICYDVHVLTKQLARKKADIILYSVGWYGPNTENWYKVIFPRRYVVPNSVSVVVANWSADDPSLNWPGCGYSCVTDARGRVLNMAKCEWEPTVVFADLPVSASIARQKSVN